MPLPRTKEPVEVSSDLTRRQAAVALNCSLSKIDELIREGKLASYKLGPGRRTARRIRRAAVEALRIGGAA